MSGVRNSWLTFEKNAVFARSRSASRSARRRSSSKARALAIAVAMCSAASVKKGQVRFVERPARADAGDDDAIRAVGARPRQRQDDRGAPAPDTARRAARRASRSTSSRQFASRGSRATTAAIAPSGVAGSGRPWARALAGDADRAASRAPRPSASKR